MADSYLKAGIRRALITDAVGTRVSICNLALRSGFQARMDQKKILSKNKQTKKPSTLPLVISNSVLRKHATVGQNRKGEMRWEIRSS